MRILLLLSIFLAGAAGAQDAAPLADAERQQLRDRAKSLHEQAEAMKSEAETSFAAENKACWDKFLVNRCMDNAKKAKQEKLIQAHRVKQEARDIERDLRKREFAEREARMAEEGPQREADAAAQAEKNRQAKQEALERVEKKRIEAEQRESKKP